MSKTPENKSGQGRVIRAGASHQNRLRVARNRYCWILLEQLLWELPMILKARSTKLFSLAVVHSQNFIERFHDPSFHVSEKRIKYSKGENGQIPLHSCCKNVSLQRMDCRRDQILHVPIVTIFAREEVKAINCISSKSLSH